MIRKKLIDLRQLLTEVINISSQFQNRTNSNQIEFLKWYMNNTDQAMEGLLSKIFVSKLFDLNLIMKNK